MNYRIKVLVTEEKTGRGTQGELRYGTDLNHKSLCEKILEGIRKANTEVTE